MGRASDGSLVLMTKHPAGCGTWHWSVSINRNRHVRYGWRLWCRAVIRRGQWHDYYRLPFGYELIVSRQDFHRPAA